MKSTVGFGNVIRNWKAKKVSGYFNVRAKEPENFRSKFINGAKKALLQAFSV